MIKNLEQYPIVREQDLTIQNLIDFEDLIVSHWEAGKIRGPIHLSNGNEEQLIEISQLTVELSATSMLLKEQSMQRLILW